MTGKKILQALRLIFLGFVLVATAACGNAASSQSPASGAPAQSAAARDDILVVYFSGTGNTKRVAGDIASATGGTLFELQTDPPFTEADLNYHDPDSRISKERSGQVPRTTKLQKEVPDHFDQYKIVFIGYPIWRHVAAWPVETFVKANDFTGKTVIPFATSSSSGMGDSGTNLEKMAKGGDWQEGHRFSSGASAEEVTGWVKTLNLQS